MGGPELGEDAPMLLEEPVFDFDGEGNFVEREPRQHAPTTPAGAERLQLGSDAGASERVRMEHEHQDAGIDVRVSLSPDFLILSRLVKNVRSKAVRTYTLLANRTLDTSTNTLFLTESG
jgi:hypothetical protein